MDGQTLVTLAYSLMNLWIDLYNSIYKDLILIIKKDNDDKLRVNEVIDYILNANLECYTSMTYLECTQILMQASSCPIDTLLHLINSLQPVIESSGKKLSAIKDIIKTNDADTDKVTKIKMALL